MGTGNLEKWETLKRVLSKTETLKREIFQIVHL